MSDKSSSRVSLFIALIAIVLILGGVYLLNKSFSSSTKTAVASNANSQIKSSTANNASKTSVTKPESSDTSVTAKPATITDVSKDAKPSTSAASTSTSTTTSGVAPSITAGTTATTIQSSVPAVVKTEPKVSTEAQKPLTEGEIVAKFVGEGTGGLPKFEIQECGNKQSKLCVSPNKFIINNANKFDVKLTEGNKYKFVAKYNEDQNFIIFEAIQSITEIK
jgi:regulatory protein YycI of two-component signal transduction system YycFG